MYERSTLLQDSFSHKNKIFWDDHDSYTTLWFLHWRYTLEKIVWRLELECSRLWRITPYTMNKFRKTFFREQLLPTNYGSQQFQIDYFVLPLFLVPNLRSVVQKTTIYFFCLVKRMIATIESWKNRCFWQNVQNNW